MVPAPRYAFGDVELDTGRVLLLAKDAPVTLEPKAFAVLQLLVERAPQVVDKAEIFAVAWKDTAVTDNALTRIVAQLRRALGDDARDPRYIVTVSTRGYRLLPEVRRLEAQAPAAPVEPSTPATLRTPRGATANRRWLVAGAVAALLLIAIGGAYVAMRRTASAAAAAAVAEVAASSLGNLDLAVAASLGPEQLTAATGYDGYVAYSPDSATIAYSSDRSGALEIYVEGLAEGSVPTSLTRGAGHQAIQPAWSPDGRLIAYAELAGGGIWVVPSRGGTARKITEWGAHPTWSPDGRRIAFQSRAPADLNAGGSFGADSTIWVVDVDGRTPPWALTAPGRPVGSHGVPQWMPGTGRVLFAVAAPAGVFMGAALWTADPGTKDVRLMSAHPRLTSEFTVAPDGRGVLFAARDTNALWWLPIGDDGLTAGEPRPTALPVTGPSLASIAVSRDGRRVAWTAGASSSSIWATAAGAGALTTAAAPVVPSTDIGWRAAHPAVAADGRIAFMGNRGNAGNKIFLVEPGRPPRQLTTDARDHFSPFWLRGEDALAVLANHGDGMGWWRLEAGTGREQPLFLLNQIARPAGVQTQVVGPAAGMAISRDFRRLAVAYVRDGVPNLWTTTLGPHGPTGPLVQRTFETISGAFGAWSPDGSWLAYQCGRHGDTQLCVVDADGQAPARQLTSTPGTNFIGEWTDDDAILFAAKEGAVWNIRSVARGTGKMTAMTAFVEPRFYVRYARWDAANRRVVFERDEMTGRLWSVRIPDVTAPQSPAPGSSR